MTKLLLLFVAFPLFVSLPTISFAVEAYMCLPNNTTGFQYNKILGSWKTADFKTSDKYIVSKSKLPGYAWKVTKYMKIAPMYVCEEDFNNAGYLFCEETGEFRMNKHNLRYIRTYILGYYNLHVKDDDGKVKTEDERSSTPLIEIGKCSPLSKYQHK
jgi:hypothetical protein